MARTKKTVEVAPDKTTVAPKVTVVPDGAEASVSAEGGVDIQNTALAGNEGVLVVVNAKHGLNLRSGPGIQFQVLEVLENETSLIELELPKGVKVPDWRLVEAGDSVGWVDERFVQQTEE